LAVWGGRCMAARRTPTFILQKGSEIKTGGKLANTLGGFYSY